MTTATCGTADVGLGPTTPSGNAGRLVAVTAYSTAGTGPQPTSANGNAGSVIPSGWPTVQGGSLVPPAVLPQVAAVVLRQGGSGATRLVLIGS